jgi:hypothetical protein
MEGFNKDKRFTKVVCWGNALLIIPYLLSAFYFIFKTVTDAAFREYHAPHFLFFIILYASFIIFHTSLFIGLLGIREWSRWLILIDSIAGLLLIFTFGIVGAYALGSHPGQFVYLSIMRLGEYIHSQHLLWATSSLKATINTFNIFFFFGNPIFSLGKKHRIAHLLWIIPSALLVGLPLYGAYEMIQYTNKTFSRSAEKIAKDEFRKITCDSVRENNGKEIKYSLGEYQVTTTYHFDFTGIWVTAPDGKKGAHGGPKYFCRPGYTGPKKETSQK